MLVTFHPVTLKKIKLQKKTYKSTIECIKKNFKIQIFFLQCLMPIRTVK